MTDPTVSAFLTKLLCSHNGRLPRAELPQYLELPIEHIQLILQEEPGRFPQLSEDLVLARSPVRICPVYVQGKPEEDECGQLHLCPYYIKGKCWKSKKPACTLCHSIQSEHNQMVLKDNEISGLNEKELKVLLLQNDHSLLPRICNKYLHGTCDQGDDCKWLHVCGFFTKGACYRNPCKKSHNLLQDNVTIIFKRNGYTNVAIENLQMLCTLKYLESLQSKIESRGQATKGGFGRGRGRSRTRNYVNAPNRRRRVKKEPGPRPLEESSSQGATGSEERKSVTPDIYDDSSDDDILDDQKALPGGQSGAPFVEERGRSRNPRLAHKQEEQSSVGVLWNDEPSSTKPKSLESTTSTSQKINSDTYLSVRPSVSVSVQEYKALNIPTTNASMVHKSTSARSEISMNKSPITSSIYEKPINTSTLSPSSIQTGTSTRPETPINMSTITSSSVHKSPYVGLYPQVMAPSNVQKNPFARPDAQIYTSTTTSSQNSLPKVPTLTSNTTLRTSTSQVTSARADTSVSRLTANVQPTQRTPSNANSSESPPVNAYSSARSAGVDLYGASPYSLHSEPSQRESLLMDGWEKFDGLSSIRSSAPVRSSYSSYSRPNTTPSVTFTPVKSNLNDVPVKKTEAEKMAEYNEICLFNVWNYCKLGNKCDSMHYHLPYRWQYLQGTEWKDLSQMEQTEKAFCDPNVNNVLLVDFLTMRRGAFTVRRLSTPSSVTKPSEFVLTTEWIWYWKDERGSWMQYGNSNTKQQTASMSSDQLESIYLAGPKEVVPFQAGNQTYEIRFAEMVQRNLVYQTMREVRRRPKFVSMEDVRKLRGSTKSTQAISPLKTGKYPHTWDPKALPDIGYELIDVSPNSFEFTHVVSMFKKTLPKQSVKKLQRIQNPTLWQVFQWQKEQMKKLNKGIDVVEQHLFHGTNPSHTKAICHQNFDWRICGTNGTVYGQGSYFARDASYSHNYALPSMTSKRIMFMAHVLVGDFVKGDPTLKRPPYKYGSSTHTYDSCVDTLLNPSIFVVFEKHQIYPEYLLEYEEEKEKSCCIS
ncbi:zinc finger CCCH-type antiviral protein 1-like [Discoglossus pictus]